jgi:FkbM family methyltransferase
MDLTRISRIPKRVREDIKIITLTKNWLEILAAKLANRPYLSIKFRNGVELDSPAEVSLNFLFHEIWIDEFYSPKGYEIKSGETVVDIGANIGVFAMYAATKAPNVLVRSYEPFPKNAEYFTANQKASNVKNIEFHAVAVADIAEKRNLHVEDSWILHSLTEKGSDDGGIEVDCVSLDQVFSDLDGCDLLKLDCEGSEYEILYAASPNTLSKIRRIVCEFNILDDKLRNGDALRDFLQNNSFVTDSLRMLEPKSGFICAMRPNP